VRAASVGNRAADVLRAQTARARRLAARWLACARPTRSCAARWRATRLSWRS
jgi:hypothetical protein